MGKKLAAVAVISLFAVSTLTQSADARVIYAHTKIVHLDKGTGGGTRTVTGEIKTDAIPTRCAASRHVILFVNDVQKDDDFAFFDKPYNFSLSASDAPGTWRISVPKFKDEKTKICLGTHKSFTVPD